MQQKIAVHNWYVVCVVLMIIMLRDQTTDQERQREVLQK